VHEGQVVHYGSPNADDHDLTSTARQITGRNNTTLHSGTFVDDSWFVSAGLANDLLDKLHHVFWLILCVNLNGNAVWNKVTSELKPAWVNISDNDRACS
jgi:hypothetical protein